MTETEKIEPLALIVEDEWLVAETLELAVSNNGFRVLGPVATVDDAKALIEQECPDVALLDYRLGGDTTESLIEPLENKGVPIVILTGFGKEGLPPAYHAHIILEKPYRLTDLMAAFQKAGLSRPS